MSNGTLIPDILFPLKLASHCIADPTRDVVGGGEQETNLVDSDAGMSTLLILNKVFSKWRTILNREPD